MPETTDYTGAIDCDVHAVLDSTKSLLPFFDDHWHEQVVTRDIDRLELSTNWPGVPAESRPDWRRPDGMPQGGFEEVQRNLLDTFGTGTAILHNIYGHQAVYNDDLAAALCKATNDWLAAEWLDRDERLRASIVVPWQNTELAVEEIRRRASDRRFVEVQFLLMGDFSLGRRFFWPIYAEAEKHGLPIGVHTGGSLRYPISATGWGSTQIEDQTNYGMIFQMQLMSMMTEGVFTKFPGLRVVLHESGAAWLPQMMWRAEKLWRALRFEVPWVHRSPVEFIREHVRLTLQPFDGEMTGASLAQLVDQVGSDELFLFSSDYPHWHFEGTAALPGDLDQSLAKKILFENPRNTYSRLTENRL